MIGKLKCGNNKFTLHNLETANCLNNYFASVFSRDTKTMPICDKCSDLQMTECKLTRSKINEVLKTLKHDRAHGPDNLSSRVLKELGETTVDPLYFRFKERFENGELPKDWCDAIVIPIFKKGATNEPANYRPVSLTCIICKLMEQMYGTI